MILGLHHFGAPRRLTWIGLACVGLMLSVLFSRPIICTNSTSLLLLRASVTPALVDRPDAHWLAKACGAPSAGASAWQVEVIRWLQERGTASEVPLVSSVSALAPESRRFALDYLLRASAQLDSANSGLVDRTVGVAESLDHEGPEGYLSVGKSMLARVAEGDAVAQRGAIQAFRLASDTVLAGYAPSIARAEARHWLGRLELQGGRTDEAERAFRAAVAEDPSDVSGGYTWMAYMYLVDIAIDQGRWSEAEALAQKATALGNLYHRRTIAEVRRAAAQAASGDAAGAVVTLRAAVDADPDYAPVRVALAERYQALGQSQAALAEYRRVIEIDPDSAPARAALATSG